ncbi:MAG: DUF5668 domain-containing protein [Nanoarchaeota archaeon]
MKTRKVAGIALVLLGIFLIVKTMGFLQFSVWEIFRVYWPVGIGLIGLAMAFRMKWIALTFLILFLTVGGLFLTESVEIGEIREVVQNVPVEPSLQNVELSIEFGAGKVSIDSGEPDDIVRNAVKTADSLDPAITMKKEGSTAKVSVKRQSSFSFFQGHKDIWDVRLSPDLTYFLDLEYGAADMQLNLKEVKVDKLDIDSGASKTEIIFGRYPTETYIDTGASSIELKFPKDTGVVIEIDGGAISTNLDDFIKKGQKYYSENYDENKENINIEINAGATSIKGEFY